MIALWDTTGSEVVKALAAERHSAGGVASGLALTLVAVVEEKRVREVEAAMTIAAERHPCRMLIVIRRDALDRESRLDAEIVVGGRLGPGEAVVMRMHGRLALHAESVVMPLLAPDVPVVTWWHGPPPDRIAADPLGVVADRRITDAAQAEDPVTALRMRADDYAPGDTDLSWTRITPWRTLLAGAFDAATAPATAARILGSPQDPRATLMAGWLAARLGIRPEITDAGGKGLVGICITLADGREISLHRENGTALLRRTGLPDRTLTLLDRTLGEDLAEELRRLDPDQPYAAALSAATGIVGLDDRPPTRVHVWFDPAVAEAPNT